MKATIDINDAHYRMLKVQAARSGCTIRELVAIGVRYVLGIPEDPPIKADGRIRSPMA